MLANLWRFLQWLLLFFLPLHSQPADPVWAIGEGFRVDPLTGRLRQEQRLGGNPIPNDFDYTRRDLAWDAAAVKREPPRISALTHSS